MTGHEGRRYFVTGAGSGIGRATALLLTARGARVAVADRNTVAADQTTAAARAQTRDHACALSVELDVSQREAWVAAAETVGESFGGIDGLVNNAGITRDKSLGKMTDADWSQVIDVHLRGSWLGCQVLLPHLISSGAGAIVNISSSGRHGSFGQSNYSAAKAGIVGLTKTVAVEVARHSIRCNAVAPGAVDTPMLGDVPDRVREKWQTSILLGRLGRPEEVGETVAFLLSPAASYITAHVLDVTGGELHP